MVKNLPANAGDIRDVGPIPGWGRSPGGGHGNPLQCSGLEDPMDTGAWWVTVHGVPKPEVTAVAVMSKSLHFSIPALISSSVKWS